MRSAWIEVNLDAISHNVREVKRFVGEGRKVMAVVKANAYGHGLIEVASTSVEAGADAMCVAILEEAIQLRDAGLHVPILVLGPGRPEHAEELVHRGVSQMVSEIGLPQALSREAVRQRSVAQVHVKVDTGMGRIGISSSEMEAFIRKIRSLPGVEIEGMATHFSTADGPDLDYARIQLRRFCTLLREIERTGVALRWRHAANSGATVRLPESHLDGIRTGLLLYGIPPTPDPPPMGLMPALTLKARITQVKEVGKGESISYGRTFVTERPSRLALVPVGYADGYSWYLSNRGSVLVKGRKVPIRGRVCMDQFVVDVTDVRDVCLGDEVVLIGAQDGQIISVWDIVSATGSVPHEVVSTLGVRLPRVFVGGA